MSVQAVFFKIVIQWFWYLFLLVLFFLFRFFISELHVNTVFSECYFLSKREALLISRLFNFTYCEYLFLNLPIRDLLAKLKHVITFTLAVIRNWCLSSSKWNWQKLAPEVFCKKNVSLKVSQNSQESTGAGASGLQLYKDGDSDTGLLLKIFRNFLKHFFCRTTQDDCFWTEGPEFRNSCHRQDLVNNV